MDAHGRGKAAINELTRLYPLLEAALAVHVGGGDGGEQAQGEEHAKDRWESTGSCLLRAVGHGKRGSYHMVYAHR